MLLKKSNENYQILQKDYELLKKENQEFRKAFSELPIPRSNAPPKTARTINIPLLNPSSKNW